MTAVTPDRVRDLLEHAGDGDWYSAGDRILADNRPLPVAEWATPANAELIAAAPDIAHAYLQLAEQLEALRRLNWVQTTTTGHHCDYADVVREILEAA